MQQYSYLLEKRLFQLTLADLEERTDLTFSQSFQRALKQVCVCIGSSLDIMS